MEQKIEDLQKKCNLLYHENGLTDEVLDMQIMINKLRHEHDIQDKSNALHEDFVQ